MNTIAVVLLLVQAPVLQRDGLQFKDLNRNGVLDPYEDWRLSPEQRARDLVARMTLEEKAGTMMHGTVRAVGRPMAAAGMGGQYDTTSARALIDSVKVTNLITRLNTDPRRLAVANNVLQAIAERTRLGIPLTISTDPLEGLPRVLGALTRVDPLTYGVDGVRGVLIGRTHFGVALDVAVLLGVGVLFVLVGAWRFSKIEA